MSRKKIRRFNLTAFTIVLLTLTAAPAIMASNKVEAGTANTVVAPAIAWQHSWPNDLFDKASKGKKLVILDLEAIWCHWCHVMDEKTYADPAVAKIIGQHFIAVKVDQDSRPDLSNRYEEYGWPATIIFDSHGKELAKLSGYIPPDEMKELLENFVKDPTPGPSAKEHALIKYSNSSSLPSALKADLLKRHLEGYDDKYGSWGTYQKFLDWDSVEFALLRARQGDAHAQQMAKQTLTEQLHLLDPIWGGIYQYSTDGDWDHPHFEKIMQFQGENLKVYAQGYSQFRDPKYLAAAKSIYGFLHNFLESPDGAFYTSMDADIVQGQHSDWYFKLDDAGRRKHGIPRVDKNIYARENGWAISGIVALYAATGSEEYLQSAIRAANWIIDNRSLPGGGFAHGSKNDSAPYLGDNVYMGRALVALYAVTGDRKWLAKAQACADFINQHFKQAGGLPGYITADTSSGGMKAEPLLDENVAVAVLSNQLFHYGGQEKYKAMAQNAMKYLATPEIANKRRVLVAGILLADAELSTDPVHITVVGKKDDSAAKALFVEAIKYPDVYKRVEWWDAREGPLPHSDVELPELPEAAAFSCGNGRCSRPARSPAELVSILDKLHADKPETSPTAESK